MRCFGNVLAIFCWIVSRVATGLRRCGGGVTGNLHAKENRYLFSSMLERIEVRPVLMAIKSGIPLAMDSALGVYSDRAVSTGLRLSW